VAEDHARPLASELREAVAAVGGLQHMRPQRGQEQNQSLACIVVILDHQYHVTCQGRCGHDVASPFDGTPTESRVSMSITRGRTCVGPWGARALMPHWEYRCTASAIAID